MFPRERPEARAMVGRWLVAFIFTAKWALREEGRLRSDVEGWLEKHEADDLVSGRLGVGASGELES